MTFSLATEKKSLDCKVQALEGKNWLPAELLDIISFTATAQAESQARCAADAPRLATLHSLLQKGEAHRQGAPLLERALFPLDRQEAASLFSLLLAHLCNSTGHLAEPARRLQKNLGLALGAAAPDPQPMAFALDALLQDDQEAFALWAKDMPEAPQLLYFLSYNSMVPGLSTLAQAAITQSFPLWQHGHCPVCGGLPFIGQLGKQGIPAGPWTRTTGEGGEAAQRSHDQHENLHDTDGQRFHVCSFCRAAYRVKRLQCPFCLEEDQHKLAYFSLESVPGYQAHVCHSCKAYIKIADFREYSDRPSLPALNDLESLPLDIAAQQQGLHRLTLSAWGF